MNQTVTWYEALSKPTWAPSSAIFGPVWTVLYIVIAVSFLFVFYKVYKREWSRDVAAPFALNLIFNLLYSPIQFGLRENGLAAVDIVLVLATLIWALYVVWRRAKWVALMNVPYLLWVSFATILQMSVVWLNR